MKYQKLFYLLIAIPTIYIVSCSFKVEKDFSHLDLIMQSAIKDSVFPGAALLFGVDQEVFYSKAFGNFTYDKNSPSVQTNSIFDLASVSKVVGTTSAAMILVQDGKFKLDDKVIKYLPQFNNKGKDQISIRNLFLHNSGLPAFKKYYDIYSTSDEVKKDIMNLDLDNPPGEKYVYSDLGMIVLQQIIEKISGKSLDVFLNENLFSKLEMNQTMYNPSNEIKNKCVPTELDNFWRMRLLRGEVHDERAFMLNGVAGHAGLFSSIEDLSKFVMMYLNHGIYNSEEILDSRLIKDWTTKQSEQSDRGLGWDTKSPEKSSSGNYFSLNSFGHTGYTGTSIWVDKETKLFVILLSNRVHPTRANTKISDFRPIIHDAIYTSIFRLN
ncbi:MAG: serine hydrolase domain-containing protein [Melioribacteraceae bacterium]